MKFRLFRTRLRDAAGARAGARCSVCRRMRDGRALFDAIVEDPVPGLWEGAGRDQPAFYVFECVACKRRRAHWDVA